MAYSIRYQPYVGCSEKGDYGIRLRIGLSLGLLILLIGFLSGPLVYGIVGFIVGPLILGVTYAVLDNFRKEYLLEDE